MSDNNDDADRVYPFDLTISEIEQNMRDQLQIMKNREYAINVMMQLGPIVTLGSNEIQRRYEIEAMDGINETHKLSNKVIAISVIAITISLIALFHNNNSNKEWQQHQLELLESINKNISTTNGKIK